MAVAGALAFLLTYAALRDTTETVELALAKADVAAGAGLTSELFEPFRVPIGDAGPPPGLVTMEQVATSAAAGRHVSGLVSAGSLLRTVDVAAEAQARPRAMSLSVDRARAAGGSLGTGDVVDVIRVDHEGAGFIAVAVAVVAVDEGGSAAGRSLTITLEVDAPTSLRLAHALSGVEVHLVRSTSSARAPADLMFPPPAEREMVTPRG